MKFRQKILLCMVCVLALSIGAGGAALIHGSFSTALQREKDRALDNFQMLTATVGVVWQSTEQPTLQEMTDTLEALSKRVTLSGIALHQGAELLFWHGRSLPTIGDLPEERYSIRISDDSMLQLSGWLYVGSTALRLTLISDISDIFILRQEMLSTFTLVYLAAIVLGGLVSYASARLLTKPLSRVSRATRKMAQGDLTIRLQSKGSDEVALLGQDFDRMAQGIQDTMKAMEENAAAQERFMASFAHELKTPMTSIIGYADLLRSQELSPSDAKTAANYIFSEGQRLESLSMKLLQLLVLRQESLTLASVEVRGLVAAVVDPLRPICQRQGITLVMECEAGIWRVDAPLLQSVLTNLLDNARKAIDGIGKIRVILDFPPNSCRIRITDNGRGIPSKALGHLTEAFYRVDKSRSRAQGGVGLGLSLCYDIVRRHGGSLQFFSVPGEGTTVTVLLKEETQ